MSIDSKSGVVQLWSLIWCHFECNNSFRRKICVFIFQVSFQVPFFRVKKHRRVFNRFVKYNKNVSRISNIRQIFNWFVHITRVSMRISISVISLESSNPVSIRKLTHAARNSVFSYGQVSVPIPQNNVWSKRGHFSDGRGMCFEQRKNSILWTFDVDPFPGWVFASNRNDADLEFFRDGSMVLTLSTSGSPLATDLDFLCFWSYLTFIYHAKFCNYLGLDKKFIYEFSILDNNSKCYLGSTYYNRAWLEVENVNFFPPTWGPVMNWGLHIKCNPLEMEPSLISEGFFYAAPGNLPFKKEPVGVTHSHFSLSEAHYRRASELLLADLRKVQQELTQSGVLPLA